MSDIGIVAMAAGLTAWAIKMGFWHMAAVYLFPLVFTNCWLVLYTWLQHTDVDVPHFEVCFVVLVALVLARYPFFSRSVLVHACVHVSSLCSLVYLCKDVHERE